MGFVSSKTESALPTIPAPSYRKHFIPLESSPEVFNELIQSLGVSNAKEALRFEEIYTLDDRALLRTLFRLVHALILVVPTTTAYEDRVRKEDAMLEEYDECGDDEVIMFFRQTINNACGLYAILHGLFNGTAGEKLEAQTIPSSLTCLRSTCKHLKPKERALALENDKGLEEAYAAVARKGATTAPENPEDEVDYHYICFVKSHKDGRLYQMDGDRKRPIDLGPLAAGEDVLSDKCLDAINDLMSNEQGKDACYNLMALVSG